MDPALDPRLQQPPPPNNESTEHTFEQPESSSYPEVPDQTSPPVKHPPVAPGVNSTPQQQQQQYYGAPTPSSYNSSETPGSGQTYPYDNGLPPYGVPPTAHYGGSLPTAAEVAADLKRPRACEACRQLKVKCEPDDVVAGTCRRCFRSGRQCVITMPTRKRQKKTDSRVAELEKRIDALTRTLHAHEYAELSRGEPSSDAATGMGDARAQSYPSQEKGQWLPPRPARELGTSSDYGLASPSNVVGVKRKLSSEYPQIENGDPNLPSSKGSGSANASQMSTKLPAILMEPGSYNKIPQDHDYVDIVDRGIIDVQTAYQCFDRYVDEMAPTLPFVVFAPGTRVEDVRRSKPVLFLAIMSVAIGTIRPSLYQSLITETVRIYADRVVCRGEKSMEMVQALLVSTIWYAPPDRYEEINFNQLIHMAAVMAIDIGMGKRVKTGNMNIYKEYVEKRVLSKISDPDAPETRRTWLGCYFMCANSAMSLRRPVLIRWTGYMYDSLELLETHKEALPSDKWLACLIRGQHIVEEVGFQFSMDDPTVEISITEPKTQYHLKAFERQLAEWRSRTPKELQHQLFLHASNITSLYVHEISMHHHHNIDDFKPPYNVQSDANSPEPDAITPAHIDSLSTCIQSIHGALDAILAMDMTLIRSLPTLSFVRTSYAAVALIKLSSAISGTNRRFGDVFKQEDLKAEHYLDAVGKHLRAAGEADKSRVAGKFSFIFSMLLTWYHKLIEGDGKVNVGPDAKSMHSSPKNTPFQTTDQQDPSSTQWSNTAGPKAMGNNAEQSGLHMLSEVASSSNNTVPDTSAADAASIAVAAGGWSQPQGMGAFPGDLTAGTMSGFDIDALGFDEEDWNALGFAVNDPTWMNVPIDQTGWGLGI